MSRLTRRVRKYLDDTSGAPVGRRLRDGAGFIADLGRGLLCLGSCNRVGWGTRITGATPHIRNLGRIEVGHRLVMQCGIATVSLCTAADGYISIGNSVVVNFGTVIAAKKLVRIADGVSIGPYVIVSDTDSCDPESHHEARTIEIERDVWLAARVTVLPGSRIGQGSVITAGSVVTGDIPPGVVAGGIPARVIRKLETSSDVKHASNSMTSPAPGAPQDLLRSSQDWQTKSTAAPVDLGEKVIERPQPSQFGLIVSDFTITELEHLLNENDEDPVCEFSVAPYGQVVQSLMSTAPQGCEVVVVWTRPESAIPAFGRILSFESVSESDLLDDLDAYVDLIVRAAGNYKSVLVCSWVVPSHVRGLGLIDARSGGVSRALAIMNLRLMSALEATTNVFVLNTQRWVESAGAGAMNPKLWHLGKVPFHHNVFAASAKDIKASLAAIGGKARKLLVLDLDDTLWGGIVGDQGWENLRLGGHDSIGESFVEFQKAIKDLQRRGVVLALASKNEESVALEAIRRHPEMVLREEDFVAWRINWEDKARNIAELTAELNLGLQSVVFIDDNPVERARVREALPEVLVPEWPEDKLMYAAALRSLRCFDTPTISYEDLKRTKMYTSERQRESLKVALGSLDDWLESLGMVVKYAGVDAANLARTTQLLNKTNQMNLSTRRLTETEVSSWVDSPARQLWVINVSDRFGDAGLTGIVSLEYDGDCARIVDFVLSCRVMGRKVEEAMIHIALNAARARGCRRVEAQYLGTPKNKPCLEFWKRSGFEQLDGDAFAWNITESYPLPSAITLEAAS
jgi:FkbH-like protein